MYCGALTERKLKIWLAAALCPVAVQLAAGVNWIQGAMAAVVSLAAVWTVWRWGKFTGWIAVGAAITALLLTMQILGKAAEVWRGNSDPAVPLLLLVLALWSSRKGAEAAASVGCLLFGAVLLVYPLVCGAALGDICWSWTRLGGRAGWELWLLLGLPTVGKLLMGEKSRGALPLILVGLTALSGLLTAGILGRACDLGFYEMVRAIDLLGAVKHFEALISATATLGWFALLSFVLTICGGAGEMLGGNGRMFATGGAVMIAGGVLCKIHIPRGIFALTAPIFWVLLPLLTQGIDKIKNRKKSKKSP